MTPVSCFDKWNPCALFITWNKLNSMIPGLLETRSSLWCIHEPLARYETLRVAHALGMPGTFPPPPRISDPDMHHGTCMTHDGIANKRFPLKYVAGKTYPDIPSACATRNFTYLARGPCSNDSTLHSLLPESNKPCLTMWRTVCRISLLISKSTREVKPPIEGGELGLF